MLLKDEDEDTPHLFSSVCQMYNVVNLFLKYPPSHNHYGDFNTVTVPFIFLFMFTVPCQKFAVAKAICELSCCNGWSGDVRDARCPLCNEDLWDSDLKDEFTDFFEREVKTLSETCTDNSTLSKLTHVGDCETDCSYHCSTGKLSPCLNGVIKTVYSVQLYH